jgi:DNA recombination protein RmuC
MTSIELSAALALIVAVIATSAWLIHRAKIKLLVDQVRSCDEAARNQEQLLLHADQRLRESFAMASREALASNSEAFLNLARASLGEFQVGATAELESRKLSVAQMVEPVREGLQRVGEMLQLLDRDRSSTQATLVQHLRHMAEAQQRLIGETELLGRALRTPHVRGQWGEMQLRRAVELAGMIEHCDFVVQHSIRTDLGLLRPDLVVHLPGKKVVVIDAKAPLGAYLEAMEAVDEKQRAVALERHAAQVRAHVTALASKDYSNEFPNAPDFVLLFLPGEAFFSAACERDPALIEDAVALGVIPASPTTLITLLKAVAFGWQQERIAERSEQIRDIGIELYDRVRTFTEHLDKLRRSLDSGVTAYNAAVGSLESRVLPSARRLSELGSLPEIKHLEPVCTATRVVSTSECLVAE